MRTYSASLGFSQELYRLFASYEQRAARAQMDAQEFVVTAINTISSDDEYRAAVRFMRTHDAFSLWIAPLRAAWQSLRNTDADRAHRAARARARAARAHTTENAAAEVQRAAIEALFAAFGGDTDAAIAAVTAAATAARMAS